MRWLPSPLIGLLAALALAPAASADTFAFTGTEQTYVVPPGTASVRITAVGGAGGTPPPGGGLRGGRGAIVTGIVAVGGGQILYVHVGGTGGLPAGGYNGGGNGGVTVDGLMVWGGGGASDVSTAPGSLPSRVIVAAGGGGSAGIGASGGDAGAPGGCCGAAGTGPFTAQPGSQTAGGAGGGCPNVSVGCGGNGALGTGGNGGASGTGADQRAGGGGGGGLYGGGGGAGNAVENGGGAGGSSLVPNGGSIGPAPSTDTFSSVDIAPYTTTANSRPGEPTKLLQTMATQLSFLFHPKRRGQVTKLNELRLRNVPSGSTVRGRCRTKAGKRCGGKLDRVATTSTLRLKPFERRYRKGTQLVFEVSHPDFITQIKTLTIRKRRGPAVRTLCVAPDTGQQRAC